MTAPITPLDARLSLPLHRPGSVVRERLLCRLSGAPPGSVISIVAPPGSGKTTLLGQWSERLPGSIYLRLDAADSDPVRLLGGIASGLARLEEIPEALARYLDRPSDRVGSALLPRTVEALGAGRDPMVLMLDEIHAATGTETVDAMAWICDHLPARTRLVLASRTALPVPVRRLRMEGRLLTITEQDLALTAVEILAMAADMDRRLTDDDAETIARRTEGWAAAVYVSLNLPQPTDIRGDSAELAGYVDEQLLAPLAEQDRDWLRRASVLDVLSGAFCDAVLGVPGSQRRLRDLERRSLFVVPLDVRRTTFRLHPLVREALQDELETERPGLGRELRIRAAHESERLGDIEAAGEYALAAGTLDTLAQIVGRWAVPLYWRGRMATVWRWVAPFDETRIRNRHAAVAVLAAWLNALEGETQRAERWLAVAEHSEDDRPMPDGSPHKSVWIAALRAMMMPKGLVQARSDAVEAERALAPDGFFRQLADLARMLVATAAGDLPDALRLSEAAAGTAEATTATPGQVLAMGFAAGIALEMGEVRRAGALVARGLEVVDRSGLAHYSLSAPLFAAAARHRSSTGDREAARLLLTRFDRVRPQLSLAFPSITALSYLQAMRARMQSNDAAGARILVAEVRDVLRARPDLEWLARAVAEVERSLQAAPFGPNGEWSLTRAELRVLSMLPTHLTLREIAERVNVSPHTIKSQVMALYGKLGATSRSEAVDLAVDAGLLDQAVFYRPSVPLDPVPRNVRTRGPDGDDPAPNSAPSRS